MMLVDVIGLGVELLKLFLIGIKLDRFLFQLCGDGLDLDKEILSLLTELKVFLLKLVFLLVYLFNFMF
jgi:hypothetical protein